MRDADKGQTKVGVFISGGRLVLVRVGWYIYTVTWTPAMRLLLREGRRGGYYCTMMMARLVGERDDGEGDDGALVVLVVRTFEVGQEGEDESLEDAGEDAAHGVLRQIREPDHVEVAQQPRADFVSASARRRAGGHADHLLHVLEEELVDVVEAALVDEKATYSVVMVSY